MPVLSQREPGPHLKHKPVKVPSTCCIRRQTTSQPAFEGKKKKKESESGKKGNQEHRTTREILGLCWSSASASDQNPPNGASKPVWGFVRCLLAIAPLVERQCTLLSSSFPRSHSANATTSKPSFRHTDPALPCPNQSGHMRHREPDITGPIWQLCSQLSGCQADGGSEHMPGFPFGHGSDIEFTPVSHSPPLTCQRSP